MSGLLMKYFVLKPRGTGPYAAASRGALFKYAQMIREANPQLANELHSWASNEMAEANNPEAPRGRVQKAFDVIAAANGVSILSLGEMEAIINRALEGEFD